MQKLLPLDDEVVNTFLRTWLLEGHHIPFGKNGPRIFTLFQWELRDVNFCVAVASTLQRCQPRNDLLGIFGDCSICVFVFGVVRCGRRLNLYIKFLACHVFQVSFVLLFSSLFFFCGHIAPVVGVRDTCFQL